jgi:hypothetical protein
MRHGSATRGFNIFSTNGAVPHDGLTTPFGSPGLAVGRADHARMLAHAAKRRLAAGALSEDRTYWKACAPAALDKAIAIRCEAGLAKLP